MSAFAFAVFKAQAEDAIKMLINRRKSDFFIKTSVGGVAKQPVFSSRYSHIFPASTFVLFFGRSSFAALTSRVFFCSPKGEHFATQKQENSRRRAFRHCAVAPAASLAFAQSLHSIAARRLAQNAPLEHFAGLQPSLPKWPPRLPDGSQGVATIPSAF